MSQLSRAIVIPPPDFVSISNTPITAITNIDVTGFAPTTYDNYEVFISNGQPATDQAILEMETSTDGGTTFDTGLSDYTWAGTFSTDTVVHTPEGDPDDAEIQLTLITTNVGNGPNQNVSVKLSVFVPETTEFTTFIWAARTRGATDVLSYIGAAGDRQSAADVDALRFHWSAGLWAAQGDIQFLGIAQ